jgi:hypothetical protein
MISLGLAGASGAFAIAGAFFGLGCRSTFLTVEAATNTPTATGCW